MLVNHPFGLIKSHQGIKRKVSQEPGLAGWRCLAAPSRAARGTGGGKIVWYQRKLLRTAPNRFSSFFFLLVLYLTSAFHLRAGKPLLGQILCRGAYPTGSLVFLCLQRQAGGQGKEGGRAGRTHPSKEMFPCCFSESCRL